MSRPILRTLVLACGLTLALPPGWCCILAVPAPPTPAKATMDGCSSCCHKQSTPAPGKPVDTPKPYLPVCCCCPINARTVEPVQTTSAAAEPAVTPALVPPPVAAPPPGWNRLATPPYATSVPLHVLRCVWLC